VKPSSEDTPLVPEATRHERRTCWGLFHRQERWGLSGRGWLALAFGSMAMAAAWVIWVYPFFAITRPVDAPILAVEGWVHEYAIRAAVAEFKRGNYTRVYTTGGPVQGLGGYLNDYSTAASIGAGRLRAEGLTKELVQMVPARSVARDRTFSAAVALKNWLRENKIEVKSINVLTEDVHARRTRLLFQKAFGDEITVGVIAVPSPDYDSSRWWRYSEGVRAVLGETIAYVYAKVFFFPDRE